MKRFVVEVNTGNMKYFIFYENMNPMSYLPLSLLNAEIELLKKYRGEHDLR